jgi:putative hydrolase of the HAD superfamily
MSARRPALIFDLGNVLAFFDYARACEFYGHRAGVSGPEFLQRLRDRGFNTLVQAYEVGAISSDEFTKSVGKLAELDLCPEEFAAAWADIFWLNEPVADLVKSLKARGYTLVLGSNTNPIHATHFRRVFREVLADFDQLVLSFEIGHIKPTAGFYRACAQAAGVEPGECVFIDDLAENVAGAREAGLQAVHFRHVEALLIDLEDHGVELDEESLRIQPPERDPQQ